MKTKTMMIGSVLLAGISAAAARQTPAAPAAPAPPPAPGQTAPVAAPSLPAMPRGETSAARIVVPTMQVEQIAEPIRWKFTGAGDAWENILRREGPVTYLGVSAAPPPRELAPHLPIPENTGLVVDYIAKDSPAEKAGLLEKDVLAKLGDQVLIHPRQLAVLVANLKEGESVKIAYVRKGQLHETTAVLGKQEYTATATPAEAARAMADVFIAGEQGRPLKTFIRRLEKDAAEDADREIGHAIRQAQEMIGETAPDDYREELREIREMVEDIRKRLEKAE